MSTVETGIDEDALKAAGTGLPESETTAMFDAIATSTSAKDVWMAARDHYLPRAESGVEIDPLLDTIQRIVNMAESSNVPLHPNDMRVDWAHSLGARERAYVMGFRATLQGIVEEGHKLLDAAAQQCVCERQPGTNADCPVHQTEETVEPSEPAAPEDDLAPEVEAARAANAQEREESWEGQPERVIE